MSEARKWFLRNYPEDGNKIYTSKFYTPAESWSKKAVWWPEIPLTAIDKTLYNYVHLVFEPVPGETDFNYLKVPVSFLNEHAEKFHRNADKLSLYLSAEPDTLFTEQRGREGLDFSPFLMHGSPHYMDQLLRKAINIAAAAHRDQKDKFGAPYMSHIQRVMDMGKTVDEKILGILHDLVEDTPWTFEKLTSEKFPYYLTDALKCVTKETEEEDYEDFTKRIKNNPLAVRVKLNDLTDNMDIRRMPQITEKDTLRLNKYLKAYRFLQND